MNRTVQDAIAGQMHVHGDDDNARRPHTSDAATGSHSDRIIIIHSAETVETENYEMVCGL